MTLVAAAAVAVAFLGSRQVHRNYMRWLLPPMAIALTAKVWGDPSVRPTRREKCVEAG